MSLDYPEFEKIRENNKLLALLWRVGDIGYYVGLVLAVISPLVFVFNFVVQYFETKIDFETFVFRTVVFGGGSFFGFLLLWYLSAHLKNFAHKKYAPIEVTKRRKCVKEQ